MREKTYTVKLTKLELMMLSRAASAVFHNLVQDNDELSPGYDENYEDWIFHASKEGYEALGRAENKVMAVHQDVQAAASRMAACRMAGKNGKTKERRGPERGKAR